MITSLRSLSFVAVVVAGCAPAGSERTTPPTDVTDYYTVAVTAPAVTALNPRPTFTITFTPTGSQASDGALTLDQSGNKTPADKWTGR